MDTQTADNSKDPIKLRKIKKLAIQVLDKIKNSEVTSYTEILKKICKNLPDGEYKNIYRRVYDVLNILRGIDIISKNKKNITYQGYYKNSVESIQKNIAIKNAVILEKREALNENLMHYIALKKLLIRNMNQEIKENVLLPCIFVKGTKLKMEIQDNDAIIVSKNPMEIYNDTHVVENINFHHINEEEIVENFPKELLDLLNNEKEIKYKRKNYKKMKCNNY